MYFDTRPSKPRKCGPPSQNAPPQPSTESPPDTDELVSTQMQVKRLQKIIDLQQGLLERVLQGNISDDSRTEYIDKINEMEANYSHALGSIDALVPKSSPERKRARVKETLWDCAVCQPIAVH